MFNYKILMFENPNIGIARIRYNDWFVIDCNNCFAKFMGYNSREDIINNILNNMNFIYKMWWECDDE